MRPLNFADSWTATSAHVYYTSQTSAGPALAVYDFSTRDTRIVSGLKDRPAELGGLGMSVSADERWLLYTRYQRLESDIMMIKRGR
jgi:hypothetical protein